MKLMNENKETNHNKKKEIRIHKNSSI